MAPLSTFSSLHELGVQLESAFKKGIIHRTSEPPRRPFSRNTNASSSIIPQPVDVNNVVTTAKMADSFATATTSQPSQSTGPLQNRRVFTSLHMSPIYALKLLMQKGYLKPLDPRPLPDPLLPKQDPNQFCIFHQQHGHPTDMCYRLRHEIHDLIDSKVSTPFSKPNVTTNPLPAHNQVPPPRKINPVQTLPPTITQAQTLSHPTYQHQRWAFLKAHTCA